MADVKATKSGNWSDTTVWSTGLLPGVADVVYSNNFTITIDQDITVGSLTNASGGTVAATGGGQFNISPGVGVTRTVAANVTTGAVNQVCANWSGAGTVNWTGSITGGTSGGSGYGLVAGGTGAFTLAGNAACGTSAPAINISGACAFSMTGSLTCSATGNQSVLTVTANANVTFNGNLVNAGLANSGSTPFAVSVSAASTITVNGDLVGGSATNQQTLSINAAATVTITGKVQGGSASGANAISVSGGPTVTVGAGVFGGGGSNSTGITFNGAGTVNVSSGGVTAGTASNASGIVTTNAANLNITGDVISGAAVCQAISMQGNGNAVAITGNVTAGSASSSFGIQCSSSGSTLNVTGNVTGGSGNGNGIGIASTTAVTVTGNVIGGSAIEGISVSSGGSLAVFGTARASTAGKAGVTATGSPGAMFVQVAQGNDYPNAGVTTPCPGVLLQAVTHTVTVDAIVTGTGGVWGVGMSSTGNAPRTFIRSAGTNYVNGYESNLGSASNIGEISADYPVQADVRHGTSYAFGGKTGACHVPPAGSVAFGVAVDASTGTAVLDVETLLGSDLKTRLQSCSTVQSTGDQLAALSSYVPAT